MDFPPRRSSAQHAQARPNNNLIRNPSSPSFPGADELDLKDALVLAPFSSSDPYAVHDPEELAPHPDAFASPAEPWSPLGGEETNRRFHYRSTRPGIAQADEDDQGVHQLNLVVSRRKSEKFTVQIKAFGWRRGSDGMDRPLGGLEGDVDLRVETGWKDFANAFRDKTQACGVQLKKGEQMVIHVEFFENQKSKFLKKAEAKKVQITRTGWTEGVKRLKESGTREVKVIYYIHLKPRVEREMREREEERRPVASRDGWRSERERKDAERMDRERRFVERMDAGSRDGERSRGGVREGREAEREHRERRFVERMQGASRHGHRDGHEHRREGESRHGERRQGQRNGSHWAHRGNHVMPII